MWVIFWGTRIIKKGLGKEGIWRQGKKLKRLFLGRKGTKGGS